MLYRLLRGINEIYGMVALFAFIAAFFIAFAFTVIYPLVPILLVVSSVFLVVGARLGYLTLRMMELNLARRALTRGLCPLCGGACEQRTINAPVSETESAIVKMYACTSCRARFALDGSTFVEFETPSDSAVQQSAEVAQDAPVL